MAVAFLVVSVIGALFTLNAFRPLRFEVLCIFTFSAGWLTSELPLHHIAWQAIATVVFVAGGALDRWEGWLGLAITAASWAALVVMARQSFAAGRVADAALGSGPTDLPTPRQWRRLAMPFAMGEPGVEAIKDIPYVDGAGRRQQLDIYRPATPVEHAPVLVYIHGGGWVFGDKREQGLPMMRQLAAHGWVCATINYRLSPKVAFPEHLVDCKRALAWVKAHIAEYGGDPDRIAVSGGSAGGHLAALVALTADRREYQPGFEDVDLHVQAAVPFYGVYDFTNRDGVRGPGFRWFVERRVMQVRYRDNPGCYEEASPMDHVNADAPPFFVVHGANDTLVPVQEARTFVRLLRDVSRAPVYYAELPGAQHAFEVFRSIRTAEVVPRVQRFLTNVLEPA